MNQEKAAEMARRRHAEWLRQKGVHSVAVEQVKVGTRKRFAVIASIVKRGRVKLPNTLPVKDKGATREVPLVIREEPQYSLD
jgi:hypothetical protein